MNQKYRLPAAPDVASLPRRLRGSLLAALLLTGWTATAQTADPVPDAAFRSVIRHYTDSVGESANLYRGLEYIWPSQGTRGHPFFGTDSAQSGSVWYDGVLYVGVPLLYDAFSDLLLLRNKSNLNIQLFTGKVTAFTLGSHRFERLPTGYYEVLYEGRCRRLLAQHSKTSSSVRSDEPLRFTPASRYYVQDGDRLLLLNGRKAVYRYFSKQKTALRKYARENRLDFKNNFGRSLVQAFAAFDPSTP
ncbi:MAG TPA: hypothetical protein VHK69_11130 [Chitinophagaceae bacterium]|jgi:hypothetical protein|nr:hypothetical protein [Chitinophagaceae bacterium]